ncbi:DUF11 domain-containing protein [Streptomyces sp. UNOC14_S4]|uniref:lectin-like domain-containing protein n=1 Tax=Streptomyces sp. UNOC14_S4 TaxID=2872340 RepID=UPI001E57659C|nr:DUF11 domain-containing protein [Streptomyces sp. UNOC14_S4]MCC3766997.1 DUF11 domain-containing protein [Streptomyces sp. UNOC14_S4]
MGDSIFPINEPFTGEKPNNPHWEFLGTAGLPGGFLQLTQDQSWQAGTAFLNQPFKSDLGVSIEFDYAVQASDPDNLGDGFSVYLIDGSKTTEPGATGAGLGYSVNTDAETTAEEKGVTAGYVGVGFDNYGNFSSSLAGGGSIGRRKHSAAVRGSGSRDDPNADEEYWLQTSVHVPGGFCENWEDEAHIQITIIDGAISVRHSNKADPHPKLLIDGLRLHHDQVRMPPTFKLGLAASTGTAMESHQIKNLHVSLPADIPLKIHGPATATAGDSISYTVTVRNDGPNAAKEAEIVGNISTEILHPTLDCEVHGGAGKGTGSLEEGVLKQPLSLPKGGSATITVTGTINPDYSGPLVATTKILAPEVVNTARHQGGTVDTRVRPRTADIPLSMTGTTSATAGGRASYIIAVHNEGPCDAPDAVIKGSFPPPLRNLQWTCTPSGGASYHGGSLDNGTLHQPARIPKGGSLTVQVSGDIADDFAGPFPTTSKIVTTVHNIAQHTTGEVVTQVTNPTADMPLYMSGPTTMLAGNTITYHIHVNNEGPDAAPDTTVEGIIPKQLQDPVLEPVQVSGNASSGRGTLVDGKLGQPLSMPKNSSAVITVVGFVDQAFEGPLTATSRVTSKVHDTSGHTSGEVVTHVRPNNLVPTQKIDSHWDGGKIWSYTVTFAARETAVERWKISFDVPKGTTIKTGWGHVIDPGTDGHVIVESPRGDVVLPTRKVQWWVEVTYPHPMTREQAGLKHLRAVQLD